MTGSLPAFTSEGTFTYTPTLTRFTVRYLFEVSEDSAGEADEAAEVEASLATRTSSLGALPIDRDRDGRLHG